MKTRVNALLLTTLLGLGVPNAAAAEGSWTGWTATVKVKVREWIAYWTPPTAVPVLEAPRQAPAAPALVGSGTTPPPPVASAPPVALRSPTTSNVRRAAEQVTKLREGLRGRELTRVSKPARAGTTILPKSSEGIPVADLSAMRATKVIARLDIGTEAEISREDFGIDPGTFASLDVADVEALPTPALETLALGAAVAPAFGARQIQGNLKPAGQPFDRRGLDKIAYASQPTVEVKPLPYQPLDEERLKMVAALILFDAGGHCHLAMGLFHSLAQPEKTRAEATYHLGACAVTLKMHQVAFDQLGRVVLSNDADFAKPALEMMARDLTPGLEEDFYRLLKGVKNLKALVEPKSRDLVNYRMAKGAFRARDFTLAESLAQTVTGEFNDDARVLGAMTRFALHDKKGATQRLEEVSKAIDARAVPDKNIRALVAVNLGRMYFATQKFGPALEQYARVPKDHPLWVQALIEQGWTQLATEDFSGAIGNMYSLHSPYFRAVYQPESFAVRTIGYLNICQYGDAYRTLTQLEKEYRDFQAKTAAYLVNKDPAAVYASARTYIKGKSTDNVDGVPYQVWREMARRPDFLNLQTTLNDQSDESTRYGGVNEKIKTEKAAIRARSEAAKKRFDDYRVKIAAFGADPARATQRQDYRNNLTRERDHVIGYRYQLTMLEQSRQGYLEFQARATERLEARRDQTTRRAGVCLADHAKQITAEMSRVLENNELLRYEVFSGSGENIRYQVAGGRVGNANRVPASIKPAKMMNWTFDGEFWEDEIGSYRSSLQNACPTTVNAQANLKTDEQ